MIRRIVLHGGRQDAATIETLGDRMKAERIGIPFPAKDGFGQSMYVNSGLHDKQGREIWVPEVRH